MENKNLIKLFLVLIIVLWASQNTFGQYNLIANVVSCSAISTNNSNFIITGTLGQPFSGYQSNSNFYLNSGFWFVTKVVTDIEKDLTIPNEYKLFNNYPNPFNPSTTIKYSITKHGLVTLVLYNLLGKRIAILVDENKEPGTYSIVFDASNISSGVYFYRLVTNDFVKTKRMLLLK